KSHALAERIRVSGNLARVLAEQVRRRDLMDVACGCLGPEERLAQAHQTFVRMQLQPQQVRIHRCLQRFDASDPHTFLLELGFYAARMTSPAGAVNPYGATRTPTSDRRSRLPTRRR